MKTVCVCFFLSGACFQFMFLAVFFMVLGEAKVKEKCTTNRICNTEVYVNCCDEY